MKHHFRISRHLKELENDQIIDVGTALGINHAKLKRMRSLPGDMVAAWLRREDDVIEFSGNPTWKALTRALSDNGQTGLATKIQQQYQPGIHACMWKALHTCISLSPFGGGVSLSLSLSLSLSAHPVLLAPIRIVFAHTSITFIVQFGVHALHRSTATGK